MVSLYEPPGDLTFLVESSDAAVATGWLLGRGPAERVEVPVGDVATWREVYDAAPAEAARATLPEAVHPLIWLLGGAILAGVGVAVVAGLE